MMAIEQRHFHVTPVLIAKHQFNMINIWINKQMIKLLLSVESVETIKESIVDWPAGSFGFLTTVHTEDNT